MSPFGSQLAVVPEIVVTYLTEAGKEGIACSVNYAVYFPFFQFFGSGIRGRGKLHEIFIRNLSITGRIVFADNGPKFFPGDDRN